jgi:hypothetical protein
MLDGNCQLWEALVACRQTSTQSSPCCSVSPAPQATEGTAWNADHIVPVYEGGGGCDLDNLRTLCVVCHAGVTRRQAAARAAERRRVALKTPDIRQLFSKAAAAGKVRVQVKGEGAGRKRQRAKGPGPKALDATPEGQPRQQQAPADAPAGGRKRSKAAAAGPGTAVDVIALDEEGREMMGAGAGAGRRAKKQQQQHSAREVLLIDDSQPSAGGHSTPVKAAAQGTPQPTAAPAAAMAAAEAAPPGPRTRSRAGATPGAGAAGNHSSNSSSSGRCLPGTPVVQPRGGDAGSDPAEAMPAGAGPSREVVPASPSLSPASLLQFRYTGNSQPLLL